MAEELIVDMSKPQEKALILSKIRELHGMHKVNICRYRKGRSLRQNRWYWPAFVAVFADYLRGQGQTVGDDEHEVTNDEVHLMFRQKFLTRTVMSKRTGDSVGDFPRSTTELSTVEFNEYLDKIAAWLSTFQIVVPEPGVYHEVEELEPVESIEW